MLVNVCSCYKSGQSVCCFDQVFVTVVSYIAGVINKSLNVFVFRRIAYTEF